jgi:hypothetical protein
MKIYDLTEEQCDMLDRLWACDTVEEIYDMFQTLDADKFNMALTLHQMMLDEIVEKDNDPNNTVVARNMLAGIGVKC